jgi:hypothetical protein
MRKIANGEEYTIPSTIEDPSVLVGIKEAVAKLGLGLGK